MQIILPKQPLRPLEMNVTTREGEGLVLLQFSREVLDVPLTLQDAAELAHALASIVEELGRKQL